MLSLEVLQTRSLMLRLKESATVVGAVVVRLLLETLQQDAITLFTMDLRIQNATERKTIPITTSQGISAIDTAANAVLSAQ